MLTKANQAAFANLHPRTHSLSNPVRFFSQECSRPLEVYVLFEFSNIQRIRNCARGQIANQWEEGRTGRTAEQLAQRLSSVNGEVDQDVKKARADFYRTNHVVRQEVEDRVQRVVLTELKEEGTLCPTRVNPRTPKDILGYVYRGGVWPGSRSVEDEIRAKVLAPHLVAQDPGHNLKSEGPTNPVSKAVIEEDLTNNKVILNMKQETPKTEKKYKALFNRQIKSVMRDLHQYKLKFGQVVDLLTSSWIL